MPYSTSSVIRRLVTAQLGKGQLAAVFLALCTGVLIVALAAQLARDLAPLFGSGDGGLWADEHLVLSKKVSLFKTLNNEKPAFSGEEIEELEAQDFIEEVAPFQSSTFEVQAYTGDNDNLPGFYTDLFFEAIPDRFLDIQPEEWAWSEREDFIPIILPKDYLNLYNFGFATSQNLPQLSENIIGQVGFSIRIRGNGEVREFSSRIVGFSDRINSILVPQAFLDWANTRFGRTNTSGSARVIATCSNPASPELLAFVEKNNYDINKEKLESSKLAFVFKSVAGGVLALGLLIVGLAFLLLFNSFQLLIERNKAKLRNLHQLGFPAAAISRPYHRLSLWLHLPAFGVALLLAWKIRQSMLAPLAAFDMVETHSGTTAVASGAVLLLLLLLLNAWLIRRSVRGALG